MTRRKLLITTAVGLLFTGVIVLCVRTFGPQLPTKAEVTTRWNEQRGKGEFPSEIDIHWRSRPVRAIVEYSFDIRLQDVMRKFISDYRPDYASFVAIDPDTGRVLSLISYSHLDPSMNGREGLATRATFPAASVFKVVTAAAAISSADFHAGSRIPVNGRNHTLYKRQVLKEDRNRWTRFMTLREAFAKSVNSAFGKLGINTVGAAELGEYAGRFGFNRTIASEIPVETGRAEMPADTPDGQNQFELAEIASGFTRETTMSPVQGALIAAAVANAGVMMEPYVVNALHSQEGELLYQAKPAVFSQSVDAKTAEEIRILMRETIFSGTSRGSFRKAMRSTLRGVEVGGKTGSLSGEHPRGKYDWFVGYGTKGGRRIALAALTIHEEYWRVKSSVLARRALEEWFSREREASGI
jgi:penicillin-binding protein A